MHSLNVAFYRVCNVLPDAPSHYLNIVYLHTVYIGQEINLSYNNPIRIQILRLLSVICE